MPMGYDRKNLISDTTAFQENLERCIIFYKNNHRRTVSNLKPGVGHLQND
jgi:hypothetical protein